MPEIQNSTRPEAIVTIRNRKGLHARASAKFVKCAETYDAVVTVTREGNLLRLLPDYEATGTQTLEVSLTGSSGATSKTIVTTTIKPLKWAVKKSWTEGAGPEGREHPSVFIDQEHGVTYMFQGSGYHPQYSPLEDSWKFDIITQT